MVELNDTSLTKWQTNKDLTLPCPRSSDGNFVKLNLWCFVFSLFGQPFICNDVLFVIAIAQYEYDQGLLITPLSVRVALVFRGYPKGCDGKINCNSDIFNCFIRSSKQHFDGNKATDVMFILDFVERLCQGSAFLS